LGGAGNFVGSWCLGAELQINGVVELRGPMNGVA
jgi:hypothetical protein